MTQLFSPFLPLSILLVAYLSACGNGTPSGIAKTECAKGAALIWVYDSTLRSLCGCDEGLQIKAAGDDEDFRCTVSSGMTVTFQFSGSHLRHQIIPSDDPSPIPTGPLYDPETIEFQAPAYGFEVEEIGTFGFEDAFNSALSGAITIQ
jgi:hypothetical protein